MVVFGPRGSTPTAANLGGELVEVPPLGSLQLVRDPVQRPVEERIAPDARRRALGMAEIALKAGPIALTPEAGEPDAGRCPVPPPIRRTGVVLRRMPRVSQIRSKSS